MTVRPTVLLERACRALLAIVAIALSAPASAQVIDVTEACAASRECVEQALDRAREALRTNPDEDAMLRFGAGSFRFSPEGSAALSIENINTGAGRGRLVIAGQGEASTALAFSSQTQEGIRIEKSSRVVVRDLHLTRVDAQGRPALFTTQGTVTRVDPAGLTLQLKIDPGFPDPTVLAAAEGVDDHEITLIPFEGDALEPRLSDKADKIALNPRKAFVACNGRRGCEEGTYTVSTTRSGAEQAARLKPGDRLALKAKGGARTIMVMGCDDCEFSNLRFTRMAGVALTAKGSRNQRLIPNNGLVVDHVTITRADPIGGIAPFLSGPGGGLVMSSAQRGVTVTDSTVIGTADDGIAVFSMDARHPVQGTRIERNTVRDNQARGILVTVSDGGRIVGNTLVRNSASALLFRTFERQVEKIKRDQDEGDDIPAGDGTELRIANWEVADNTIGPTVRAGALRFYDGCEDGCGTIANVVVRDNRFVGIHAGGPLVEVDCPVDSAKPIRFEGNQLETAGTVEALVETLDPAAHIRGESNRLAASSRIGAACRSRFGDCAVTVAP